jgi:hypothetical protein
MRQQQKARNRGKSVRPTIGPDEWKMFRGEIGPFVADELASK